MGKVIQLAACAAFALLISGCVNIKGVSNTSLVRPLPPAPTFQLENLAEDDPAIARKVGQMVAYQLLKQGFRNPAKDETPDLKARFSYDVVPAGVTSTAFTTINQPKQNYYVTGNTVTKKGTNATATTVVSNTQEYQRTVALRILDTKTGAVYWEGNVSSVGSCNRIFVTAPNILALMFEKFPGDVSNSSKVITDSDPAVQELRGLFPGTEWGCR
ncbi:MAG: DUF4136 domain-containing protein [Rhodocyclaceae bacterium]|nr:DUF4136 domain-containing protein [Rhodocyclaceae bacterium]